MRKNTELLNHLERIHDDYGEVVDKISTEDKLLIAAEEQQGLAPWEISAIVQGALSELPEALAGHADSLFDIVYDAVTEALDKSRG